MRPRDKEEDGVKLLEILKEKHYSPDIVVSYSVESLEMGKIISDELDADLQLKMAESLHIPGKPDTEFGAISDDGTLWIDKQLKEQNHISNEFILKAREIKSKDLKDISISYRSSFEPITGKKVLLIDCKLSEGFKAGATVKSLSKNSPESIAIAAPVVSTDRAVDLSDIVEQIFYLEKVTAPRKNEISY